MVNRFASSNTALTLNVVGVILILSFLLDFLILLSPFQPTDRLWQINLATALVDRGIVPMVGLGILFAAYWIGNAGDGDRSQGVDLRLPALIISSILGLIFLIIFPVHYLNVDQVSSKKVVEINKSAEQEEAQLNNQLAQFQAQLNNPQGKAQIGQVRNQAKAQFADLLKDEQKYKQALENPQVPKEQKELLKKFKANPQELDKFITQQTDPQGLASQKRTQIRQRQEEVVKQTTDSAGKSKLRICLSSFLLSIGYIIIGWTGLKGMGVLQGGGRKANAR